LPADVTSNIVEGEYFFDTDKGYNKGNKITVTNADSAVLQDFLTTTAGLALGYHKLYIRFKDSNGKWSLTTRRNIEIIAPDTTTNIVAVQYFFTQDNGFGKATTKAFSVPYADHKYTVKIKYSDIPSNAKVIFLRTKDSNGKWSITKLDSISVAAKNTTNTFAESRAADNAALSSKLKVMINPNPVVNGIMNVWMQKNIDSKVQLRIISLEGKTVYTEEIQLAKGFVNKQINISNLSAGVYFVQVTDGIYTQLVKVIKQ